MDHDSHHGVTSAGAAAGSEDGAFRRDFTRSTDIGSLDVLVTDDRAVIVLAGELDAACSKELNDVVEHALGTGHPIDVDTRAVKFMDSSAVAMLAHLAYRTNGRVRMIQPPDFVLMLLEVTNLTEVVEIVEAVDGDGAARQVGDSHGEGPDRDGTDPDGTDGDGTGSSSRVGSAVQP